MIAGISGANRRSITTVETSREHKLPLSFRLSGEQKAQSCDSVTVNECRTSLLCADEESLIRSASFCRLARSKTQITMLSHSAISRHPQSGQVTLSHLLLAIVFVMPVSGAIAELKHSGSGALRYVMVLPASLAVGAFLVGLDWKLGKALWSRGQRHSPKVQNAVAIFLFAMQLLWIVVGVASGFLLAVFAALIFRG